MASKIDELIAQRQQNAEAREMLKAARRAEAQRAEQPLRHVDPDFKHAALVAASRGDGGMRRSGVFVGPEKTLIPENTFTSEEAYNAFVNEPRLLVLDAPKSKAERESLQQIETEAEETPLEDQSVAELKETAKGLEIKGYGSMNKAKLVKAIGKAQAE